MKTIVRNIALAVAVMGLTVACHNNKPAEEPIDSTPVEEVVEETIEEAPVEVAEAVEEAPAQAAPAKKSTPKVEVKNNDGGVSVEAGDTKVEVNSGKVEVKTNNDGTVTAKPRRR
jgi:hypothetical protein